jgi:glyoxylase-like metal-dependent hydrolase (beta-lactamase superfamily II)
MKLGRFAAAAFAVLLLPQATACAEGPVEGYLQPAERVTAHVHVMRQPDRIWSAVIGNVTLVEQADGIVVIDSGGTLADGRRVAAEVRRLGSKPVKAIAITHWHNDHPLGVGAIAKEWPRARIIATEATRRRMIEVMGKNVGVGRNDPALDAARVNAGQARIAEYEANARDPKLSEEERREFAIDARYVRLRLAEQMGAYIVLPTETFRDRLRIDDPQAPVELRFVGRTNTDGDLIAWLPKQRLVVAGDMVVAPTPYGFNSYPSEWIAALEALKGLDFAYLVPGHGKVQRDTAYLDKVIASLTEVRAQVAALAQQGLTLDQVMARIDHKAQIERFARDSKWAERWLNAYWLEPIVSSAYREAKGLPIEPGG